VTTFERCQANLLVAVHQIRSAVLTVHERHSRIVIATRPANKAADRIARHVTVIRDWQYLSFAPVVSHLANGTRA
jgi:hypothetical protein